VKCSFCAIGFLVKSLSFGEPMVVNYVNESHHGVIVVQIELIIIVAELRFIIIVGNSLAEKSLLGIGGNWLTLLAFWTFNVSVFSVLFGSIGIVVDSHAVVHETLWA